MPLCQAEEGRRGTWCVPLTECCETEFAGEELREWEFHVRGYPEETEAQGRCKNIYKQHGLLEDKGSVVVEKLEAHKLHYERP